MRTVISVPTAAIVNKAKKLKNVLMQAGREVASVAKKGMKKGKSSPGSAPGIRTGTLKSSMKVRLTKHGVTIMDTAAKPNEKDAFYALFLETGAVGGGGKKGSRNKNRTKKNKVGVPQTKRVMKPYPYLSTALDTVGKDLEERIGRAVMEDLQFKVTKKK